MVHRSTKVRPFYSLGWTGRHEPVPLGSPLEGIALTSDVRSCGTWQTVGIFNGPVPSRLPIAATRDVAAVGSRGGTR